MIKEIYLDVDGVIVDFLGGLHETFGLPYSCDEGYQYERGKWDMLGDMPVSFAAINAVCTEQFWENLNWMVDGRDILRLILQVFPCTPIKLLTTPMPNSGSWSGKYRWVAKNLPLYASGLVVTHVPKHEFVNRKNLLLIDDRDTTVDNVKRVGGSAVLVPRMWNYLHKVVEHSSVYEYMEQQLHFIREGVTQCSGIR